MSERIWRVGLTVVLGICLLGATSRARAQAPAAAGAPRIEFAETAFDFGEIYDGVQVGHRFRFRNAGGADLHVGPLRADYVRAFCALPGALSATGPGSAPAEATSVIPPGQWGEIVATFNAEGFAVPGFDGRIVQHVTVYSDDLSRPRVKLELSGRVLGVMVPDPPMLALGVMYRDREDGGLPSHLPPVTITPTPGNSFTITRAESNSPFFRPTVAPAPDGKGFVVSTEVDPAIPNGELKGAWVRIHTTHPKKPELTIPVSGAVVEARPIVALPSIAHFGLVKAGEERTLTLKLEKGDSASWRLLRAEAKVEGAPVSVAFTRVGPAYEVTLSLKAPAEPFRAVSGSVTLTTDNARKPVVALPLRAWVYAEAPFALPAGDLNDFVARVLRDETLSQPEEVLTKVLAGAKDRRALDPLLAALQNGGWYVKMRAAILLGKLGNAGAVEALEAASRSDEDEDVREESLVSVARLAPDRALPDLLRGLRDQDSWVRERMAGLLGELGDRRAIPDLLRAMQDQDEDVALAAAQAVESLAKPGS